MSVFVFFRNYRHDSVRRLGQRDDYNKQEGHEQYHAAPHEHDFTKQVGFHQLISAHVSSSSWFVRYLEAKTGYGKLGIQKIGCEIDGETRIELRSLMRRGRDIPVFLVKVSDNTAELYRFLTGLGLLVVADNRPLALCLAAAEEL